MTASAPASAPTMPLARPRGALARDALGWFVPLSIAVHALTALPWHTILLAFFHLLGVHSDVTWKEGVDAPTVIPIDLDALDEVDESAPPPNVLPPGPDDPTNAPGPKLAGDAGVETSPDAAADSAPDGGPDGRPDAPPDAPRDGLPTDASGDGEGDTPDAPPKRIKDPNAAAGGLVGLKPVKGGEVNVSVLVRTDHMRTHPIGKLLGGKLAKIEQWKPFLAGTGIDPVIDLDAIFADGPRFYETSRVTMILVHSKPDAEIALALKAIADEHDGVWVGDDEVPAFRAKIDGSDRVFVQIPGGLIITPPDGEKQALAIGHGMVKKKKTGKDLLPKADGDLVLSGYMRQPSRVLAGIPEDLTDVHVTIRKRPDDGAIVDLDAKAKDAAHAEADAKDIRKLIEGHLTGLQGAFVRKWVTGYTIEVDGDVVHVHHELSGEQLQDIWSLLNTLGVF
ncbi:MAG: hypothetical protein NVSMB47_03950 [Polyangiales bacterium]